MPNTKSAIKQNRQNKTRNRRNRMVRSAYRTALKKFTHLLENGNIADAEKELSVIHHEIDTAAKKASLPPRRFSDCPRQILPDYFMLPRISKVPAEDRLIRRLKKFLKQEKFSGEVRTSYADRLTASTDNSIYQVLPLAVLFPKSHEDTIIMCRTLSQPEFSALAITGRGGGTGTNGQSLNPGLTVDFSKYMTGILEINPDAGYVRIQPGVVPDKLNQDLHKLGYFFPPSVSTASRATLGGMISTDASGKGSRVYGKTSDYILELKGVLHDGSEFSTSPDAPSAGFNTRLTELLKESGAPFNLNKIIAGSEGTLCFITEARLRIIPIPKHRAVALITFPTFEAALNGAEIFISADPDSIETIDDKILTLAMNDEVSAEAARFFPPDELPRIKSFNLLEFSGNTTEELDTKTEKFSQLTAQYKSELNYIGCQMMPYKESKSLWEMREKGVGLLANLPGNRKPTAFVEDCAVPPRSLPAFIAEFRQLLSAYRLDYAMYGHVDAGCMHVRPALDMKLAEDEALIRRISDDVNALVRRHGGVLWGEHGKGLRSEYVPEYFGETLYGVMQHIKTLFDPIGRLNPGKIAAPLNAEKPLTKLDKVPLRGHFDREIQPELAGMFSAGLSCNGNGLCFHHDTNYVMCPSFKETRDRIHSPKGRSGVVREWLLQLSRQGYKPAQSGKDMFAVFRRWGNRVRKYMGEYDFSHEVHSAMAGCLSCKACTNQCPVKIDIPDQKALFLEQYHTRYPRPLRDFFVAGIENTVKLQAKIPRMSNLLTGNPLTKAAVKYLIGMRDIPRLSVPVLDKRLKNLPGVRCEIPAVRGLTDAVVLIQDAFTSFTRQMSLRIRHAC
ncbi:hypothetical protein CHS0354_018369 [Potamilus streckersoni]|uniref:Uncharacterized protein n=1 Tax=Potamilus streckersoni TaxID=2493646 RepID=A0AAE0TBF6_9BIVA|nr:hypothetical protein CHS0354_018369 [Potamilus streckersoni]